jgi:hypothetical protein
MSLEHLPEIGDWVHDRDGDDETRFIVVDVLDEPASEVFIETLNRTVAAWPPNREYPSDDPVVRAVPTTYLAKRFGDAWHVDDILSAYETDDLERERVRVYSYPASRLQPIE